MPHTPYLIIGGGMTGAAAANGIRELDEAGTIGLISAESDPPYDRPPLSKKLWDGKRTIEQIYVALPGNVQPHFGTRVVALDADNRRATDDRGEVHTYDRLLLATGGVPRRLPFGGEAVNYYRTLDDYRALRADADGGARFVVIGGGFIGSEVAAALRKQGNEVTLIFPEAGISDRVFPAGLAAYLNDYYREQGVAVLNGESVTGIETGADGATVLTGSGRRLAADRVVAGIGIVPNVDLARAIGLSVDNGIPVDARLLTARPEIYAAGDVANYPDAVLGARRRVEHADAARAMGRAAGRNMAGAGEPYTYLPMFYSDMFDLGYEAVGLCDSRLEIIEDWQKPNERGALYYLKDGRLCGVLLLDIWDRVDEARALIEAGGAPTAESLKGTFG
ncbi:Ferredoxin--NAD(+) reductase [Candidatus Promineifilum breve]|uniref:Ferredoxin--NAD(+) reductase n=1 Tax=Candidatus Promineifilum breve TaxID=1806508 RepID=A0A160TAD8_9CHLR|nr:FAD-dependent oxidoreductase [Candidatus Promineifilum breve]CUS06060.1 Ferredoxin--NAD(+) reductase [Candidatus Promineifilum breve]